VRTEASWYRRASFLLKPELNDTSHLTAIPGIDLFTRMMTLVFARVCHHLRLAWWSPEQIAFSLRPLGESFVVIARPRHFSLRRPFPVSPLLLLLLLLLLLQQPTSHLHSTRHLSFLSPPKGDHWYVQRKISRREVLLARFGFCLLAGQSSKRARVFSSSVFGTTKRAPLRVKKSSRACRVC